MRPITAEDYDDVADALGLFGAHREGLKLRVVGGIADAGLVARGYRLHEVNEAALLFAEWAEPTVSALADAALVLRVMQGPRRNNPACPNFQPSKYSGKMQAVVLRGPIITPWDVTRCRRPRLLGTREAV